MTTISRPLLVVASLTLVAVSMTDPARAAEAPHAVSMEQSVTRSP